VSVVVSTHRRPQFLPELTAALEDQTLPPSAFEVIVVDDGSDDGPGGTWGVLADLARRSPCRVRALRSMTSTGPAGGRNRGMAEARGEVVAFTDDDCIPQPGWLAAMLEAVDGGVDLVQGRTTPDPRGQASAGPWDRTLTVDGPTPLFETCNIAYRRAWLEQLGGFDESDPLTAPGSGRHFGEDAVLGGRLVAAGGTTAYSDAAIVHHRWLPGSFRDHLMARRRLVGFPGLARRSPVLRSKLVAGVFLSPRTAATDLAIAGVVAAAVRGHPLPLVLVAPWVRQRWPEVAGRRPSAAVRRLAQLVVADVVGAASLVEGSVRHRRLVL
jgi:glycosyltransferase involved in cell wall biosynthesis